MPKAGDANEITRNYLDSLLLETRLIGSKLGDTRINIFGREYATPLFDAAFSHIGVDDQTGAPALARGFKNANSLNFWGMCSDEEFHAITATGADMIRIIKPYADESLIFHQIEDAIQAGAVGVGMDIDHAYGREDYDRIGELDMRPKTVEELTRYVKAAGDLPFVVKGVLSVSDAVSAKEAGARGIIISHHHGIIDFAVPPLMVLPDIVDAVGGDDMAILVDCGMEEAMDAFKALALGADAVCVSRAIIKVVKDGGAEAVTKRIQEMTNQLAVIMGRTGFDDLASINESVLWTK